MSVLSLVLCALDGTSSVHPRPVGELEEKGRLLVSQKVTSAKGSTGQPAHFAYKP